MSENKLALITGGSRGIGKACALELAKAGFDIVVNYASNASAVEETLKELRAFGVSAAAVQFDVSNKEEVKTGIDNIMNEFGRIDVLVNNAGITRDNLLIRMSDEEWEQVINVNLSSAFYVTKPVAKIMMKQREGVIINMASVSGVYGNAGQANYSAAKAGLIGFTKSLAKELAARNIRVNAIAPGFIQTDMTKNLDGEKIAEAIPLKKLGLPSDIAKAVKFFVADAPYITGQILGVDGGLVI
ncbi:MAG: 3-oxoacyl-[acyl-carrier-protein] reductase [Candidatus Gastranaerophilales bacterium]|nr:3-oxoacyl-[acyl-carrier-protein] reductase [Candidatus Gastranaerophilales bacterium]